MSRIYKTPFAATGDREALADTDPGTGKVSLPTGWTADYEKEDADPNYRPVGRKEMNGIIYEVTEGLGEMQIYGFAAWQALAGGWPAAAIVRHGGDLYMSMTAANTTVPGAVGASWKKNVFGGIPGATFAELDAATSDQGPAICTDMGGMLWTWVSTAYFTGYRNPLCATIPQHFAATARAWEMPVTGGVWSESDPKQARLIAWFREQGLTVAAGSWAKGWGHIADLGGGDWKAPDLQDMFLRLAGTDADTANAMTVGQYQADAIQNITGTLRLSTSIGGIQAGGGGSGAFGQADTTRSQIINGTTGISYDIDFDPSRVARTSTETRVAGPRVAASILI